MFPLCQFVKNAKEVDAAEAVSPAVGRRVPDLQGLGRQLRLLADHTWREIQKSDTDGNTNITSNPNNNLFIGLDSIKSELLEWILTSKSV